MRIGFVGSRKFQNRALVSRVVARLHEIHGPFDFVSGGAKGADSISQSVWFAAARDWFQAEGVAEHLTIHYPDSGEAYREFGDNFRDRAFGRNKWIVDDADILVCFYATPEPKGGTLNTHNHARRKGIPIYYHTTKGWRTENV